MDHLDWFHVAPNRPQNLHVKVHRLRLGNPAFEVYPHQETRSGFFAVWIPPLVGDFTVEIENGVTASIRLWSGESLLDQVHGSRLVHRMAPGTSGRFEIHVSRAECAVRVSLTVESWPLEADGKSPLVPWNFWYFPYAERPLSSPDADRHRFPSHEVQLSAVQKYDRVFPPPPGANSAEAWEREFHCNARDGWEGHCDPSAYASVYFEQPPETVTAGGIAFTRHELELLAAEWSGARMGTKRGWHHGETASDPAFRLSGPVAFATHLLRPGEKVTFEKLRERYSALLPQLIPPEQDLLIMTEAGRIAAQGDAIRHAFGRAAVSLWRFLVDEAQGGREPIVGDVGPTGENPGAVWNHAVAAYELSVVEKEPGVGEVPDPRRVVATAKLIVNLDKRPLAPRRPVAEPDPADGSPVEVRGSRPVPIPGWHQTHSYGFVFHFESDGTLHAASWKSAQTTQPDGGSAAYAPRRFGVPARPRPAATSGNDHGRTPPANTLVGDGILQLVTLRPRYT